MPKNHFRYVIVGAGLAGVSAAQGIRELDRDDPVLLLGAERDLPYHRPPLSKKLWFGKMKPDAVFVHPEEFYQKNGIEVRRGVHVDRIDTSRKELVDRIGSVYQYEKLLLATGGEPRRLAISGGDLPGIFYYRTLADFHRLRQEALPGKTALVIGGGFIGSEIAAALNRNDVKVTMVFPDEYLVARIFPESLGRAIQDSYRERGIRILARDVPVTIEKSGDRYVTITKNGQRIESDCLIVGVGLHSSVDLARDAGLKVSNGIVVNELLETSHTDISAAGDNAEFPYIALGKDLRVEHWDNALNQGKQAGRNMAGAHEKYDYMPYFFSDLFDIGYEAVGEVDARLVTLSQWEKQNEKGVIFYTRNEIIRGVLMCNTWDKVDWARDLIRRGEKVTPESLPRAA